MTTNKLDLDAVNKNPPQFWRRVWKDRQRARALRSSTAHTVRAKRHVSNTYYLLPRSKQYEYNTFIFSIHAISMQMIPYCVRWGSQYGVPVVFASFSSRVLSLVSALCTLWALFHYPLPIRALLHYATLLNATLQVNINCLQLLCNQLQSKRVVSIYSTSV